MDIPPSNSLRSTGHGRILLWRGGSVWVGRAERSTDFHAHHAIQITLALSPGPLHFRSPGEAWQAYSAAVVPAHHPHAFEARGELVALLFVEPESCEGQALRERFRDRIAALSDEIGRLHFAALAAAYHEKHSDQALIACARAAISELAAPANKPALPLDRRIERAIELLHERLGQAINLADNAGAVHLSPERFRHLFIAQTGIRFRPYVLWLRLGAALACYAAGANLTDAAHAGGFADSAHFSRTFKRMFGAAPISIKPE
ncbi:helix-turn-helix transcriptional regulator [Pseudoduganella aquatica]|uniref:Helix-turn-helix domain-containing protein n=1 Tax=Pseudoduganella aquatica TaxID=2660641 RepID=A0A7X4KMX6_9BURK|nr:AraC family transcriptional regulator [Pseudoduganella aquatica]MYN08622.1 helix-turn-helix domain-containing protein [Pseudoduganella aquatica]